eukprot:232897_1
MEHHESKLDSNEGEVKIDGSNGFFQTAAAPPAYTNNGNSHWSSFATSSSQAHLPNYPQQQPISPNALGAVLDLQPRIGYEVSISNGRNQAGSQAAQNYIHDIQHNYEFRQPYISGTASNPLPESAAAFSHQGLGGLTTAHHHHSYPYAQNIQPFATPATNVDIQLLQARNEQLQAQNDKLQLQNAEQEQSILRLMHQHPMQNNDVHLSATLDGASDQYSLLRATGGDGQLISTATQQPLNSNNTYATKSLSPYQDSERRDSLKSRAYRAHDKTQDFSEQGNLCPDKTSKSNDAPKDTSLPPTGNDRSIPRNAQSILDGTYNPMVELERSGRCIPDSGKKKTKKKEKPSDMPRRPMSAYNFFFSDERNRLLEELDSSSFTKNFMDSRESRDKILQHPKADSVSEIVLQSKEIGVGESDEDYISDQKVEDTQYQAVQVQKSATENIDEKTIFTDREKSDISTSYQLSEEVEPGTKESKLLRLRENDLAKDKAATRITTTSCGNEISSNERNDDKVWLKKYNIPISFSSDKAVWESHVQKIFARLDAKRRDKRSHRKSHGKISFMQLAKTIGWRWRTLESYPLSYYRKLAESDSIRYKKDMEEYNKK